MEKLDNSKLEYAFQWLFFFKYGYILHNLYLFYKLFSYGGQDVHAYLYSTEYVSTYYIVDELWKFIQRALCNSEFVDYTYEICWSPPIIVLPKSALWSWMTWTVLLLILWAVSRMGNLTAQFAGRLATWSTALFWTYYFLITEINYLNHMYLFVLISWIAVIIFHYVPEVEMTRDLVLKESVRLYTSGLVKLIYSFSFIWKMVYGNDWYFRCEPLAHWLPMSFKRLGIEDTVISYFGSTDEAACWAAKAGLHILALLIFSFDYSKKAKWCLIPAWIAALLFHLSNHFLFNIGSFSFICLWLLFWLYTPALRRAKPDQKEKYLKVHWKYYWCMATLILFMSLMVLRNLYYSDTLRTDEGQQFSWKMKLRDRQSDSTGYEWRCLLKYNSGTQYFAVDNYSLWQSLVTTPNPKTGLLFISQWKWKRILEHPDSLRRFSYWLKKYLIYHKFFFKYDERWKCGLFISVWTTINFREQCEWIIDGKTTEISSEFLSSSVSDWLGY